MCFFSQRPKLRQHDPRRSQMVPTRSNMDTGCLKSVSGWFHERLKRPRVASRKASKMWSPGSICLNFAFVYASFGLRHRHTVLSPDNSWMTSHGQEIYNMDSKGTNMAKIWLSDCFSAISNWFRLCWSSFREGLRAFRIIFSGIKIIKDRLEMSRDGP